VSFPPAIRSAGTAALQELIDVQAQTVKQRVQTGMILAANEAAMMGALDRFIYAQGRA